MHPPHALYRRPGTPLGQADAVENYDLRGNIMKDHMSLAPDHSNTRASTAGSPPTGSSLNSAYREMLEAPVMAVSFGTVVGATLIYSISGPLGIEDTLAVGQRLLYLGLCAFICWPLCHSLSTTILYVMRHRTPYQILLAAVAGAAFMAIPCSAVAYAVFGVAGQSYNGGFADIYLNASLALAACSTVVHYAACLRARLGVAAQAASAAVRAMNRDASSPEPAQSPPEPKSGDIRRARDKPESTTPAATSPHRPTTGTQAANAKRSIFLDRMPDNLGQDVIYLNVSGHYVNAATTVGSGVILMRFADAIAELGDMGIQVHRSYWVAHRHIEAIFRRDERTWVRVTGGHELPVSRTYLTAVRAFIPHVASAQHIGSPPNSPTSDSPPRIAPEPRGI